MAQVVLFHHVQGLTTGVTAFADRLRAAGNKVHTPDLFEGKTFESIDEGAGYVQEVGFSELMERGKRAADSIDGPAVYAGFSGGVVPAQMLAQTRPDALGAVLCFSCVPVSEFGEAWPVGVPVQIHGMDADPYFVDEGDIDAAKALVESTADAELFLYRGDKHLFADSSLSAYDAEATELMVERILTLLQSLN